jgi:AcrR family transcriptional regulator
VPVLSSSCRENGILQQQNQVLVCKNLVDRGGPMTAAAEAVPGSGPSLAERAASRAVQPRAEQHAQEVRRLLDAGLALMSEGGQERPPRVSDIVRAAGLSNQAFYRYFRSKDELVAAIIDDGERRLVGYVAHQMAKQDRPDDRLRGFARAVADQAASPEVARATRSVLANASGAPDGGGTRSRQLADLLSALLVTDVAELGSPEPERDARTVTAAVTALMLDHLLRGTSPTARDLDAVVGFCLAGVRRP